VLGDPVDAVGGALRTDGEHQVIKVDYTLAVECELLGGRINRRHLGAYEFNFAKRRAHGERNVVFGQPCRCHLIQQWRKQVIWVAVDHRHSIRRRAAQFSRTGKTAETSADDDDVLLGRRCAPLEGHGANLRREALNAEGAGQRTSPSQQTYYWAQFTGSKTTSGWWQLWMRSGV